MDNAAIQPKVAIPDFNIAGGDAELQAAARTVAEVLWADLDFEKEFYLIDRNANRRRCRRPPTIERMPMDRWRDLGADFVVHANVTRGAAGEFTVDFRIVTVRGTTAGQVDFSSLYERCTIRNPRWCAHSIADDVHKKKRNLDGVARTKVAFVSDRDNKAAPGRQVKEIYIMDYDGANQRAFTAHRSLSIMPSWAADGVSLAYVSYFGGNSDIYVTRPDGRAPTRPANGNMDVRNYSPAISPDGTRMLFSSSRDVNTGRNDIFIVNIDGIGLEEPHAEHGIVRREHAVVEPGGHGDRVHLRQDGHESAVHHEPGGPESPPAADGQALRQADLVAAELHRVRVRSAGRAARHRALRYPDPEGQHPDRRAGLERQPGGLVQRPSRRLHDDAVRQQPAGSREPDAAARPDSSRRWAATPTQTGHGLPSDRHPCTNEEILMSRIPTRYAIVALLVFAAACGKKPPVAPAPPATQQVFPGAVSPTTPPPAPPTRTDPVVTSRDPVVTSSASDPYAGKAADEINKDSPLKPVFFQYDSDQLDDVARQTLTEDAEVLKKYANWVITIEGHCDERGTAEYNLALGDRRAIAARGFLISLGINADRLRTVSYGKEFPFDPAQSESAFEKNRRAHFTVTATSEPR